MHILKEKNIYHTPETTHLSSRNYGSSASVQSESKKKREGIDFYKRNPLPKTVGCTTLSVDEDNFSCGIYTERKHVLRPEGTEAPTKSIPSNANRRLRLDVLSQVAVKLNGCNVEKTIGVAYSPGSPIKTRIKVVIRHVALNMFKHEEDNIYYIEIQTDTAWTVRKHVSQINCLMNRPAGSRLNHVLNLESFLATCDLNSKQHFILTDIVESFELKSEYIFMYNRRRILVSIKITNRSMLLYNGKKLVKHIKLIDCDVFPLSDSNEITNGFVVFENGNNNILGCLTEAERNEWVRFIRKIIYDV